MRNLKKLFFAICCLAATASFSQVPGYQGKRLYLGYTNEFSMANVNVNARGGTSLNGAFNYVTYNPYYDSYGYTYEEIDPKEMNKTAFAFNFSHKLSLNYVTSRTSAIAFDIKYFKTGCVFSAYNYNDYDQFGNYYSMLIMPQFTKISGFGMDFQYRIFKDGLAPFGKYAGYYIGANFMKGQSPDSIYVDAAYLALTGSLRSGNVTFKDVPFKTLSLGYVYGKQNVIKDLFILDRGFSIDVVGLMVALIKSDYTDYSSSSYGSDAVDGYYLHFMKRRAQWRNSVNMYIGVKYLLK